MVLIKGNIRVAQRTPDEFGRILWSCKQKGKKLRRGKGRRSVVNTFAGLGSVFLHC
jgi:hypothetical protein